VRLLTPNLEGLHATHITIPRCPSSLARSRPSLVSHKHTLPSSPQLARCAPSGLHATRRILVGCPPTGESRWPLPTPAPRADSSQRRVGCFGVAEACLPLRHGAPGGAKPVSQCHLRQADVGAQRQHHLSEGIVSLSVRVSLHERFPFCVTRRSENYAAM